MLDAGLDSPSTNVFISKSYDVSGHDSAGHRNTIGAILGDGWYASDLAFKGTRLNYGGTPRFLAQLALQFSDGSAETVVSDGSWTAKLWPDSMGRFIDGITI